MKRNIFLLAIIGILFWTGCSKETVKHHIKAYKIYFDPTEEKKSECENLAGTLMIKDSLAVGVVRTNENTPYNINGEYNDESKELAADILDGAGHLLMIAGGTLESDGGKGTWTAAECEGKWTAIRDK